MSFLTRLLGGEAQAAGASAYRRIAAPEARAVLAAAAGARLVDVRTEGEYRGQHLPDSVLIPDRVLAQRAPALLPDKTAVLIVYCQSGMRSRKAAHALLAMGYTEVYDLGGIANWPYGTVSG